MAAISMSLTACVCNPRICKTTLRNRCEKNYPVKILGTSPHRCKYQAGSIGSETAYLCQKVSKTAKWIQLKAGVNPRLKPIVLALNPSFCLKINLSPSTD